MDAAPTGLGRLYSAAALAAELGVSRRRVYRWHDDHGLPAISIGRALYFRSADVAEWLAADRADYESAPNPRSQDLCLQTETPPVGGGAPITIIPLPSSET